MRHAIACFLHGDTIDQLKHLARSLSKKRNCEVSASEAIEYLVANHWKDRIKKRFMAKSNAVTSARPEMR